MTNSTAKREGKPNVETAFNVHQVSQILEKTKSYSDQVVRRKEKIFLAIVAFLVLGFILGFSIFAASFNNYKEAVREEIAAMKQKDFSIEASVEEINGKIDGAFDEIKKSLSEISDKTPTVLTEENEVLTGLLLPQLDTSFKSYMDYRTITCVSSDQYALQRQAYTDEFGLRKIDEYYCVALGTYYSSKCGETFKICTDSGNEFLVIVADVKDDRHTDESNMYVPLPNGNANVIEFVVDTPAMSNRVALLGDISGYEQFSGNIVKIERV